MFDKGHLAYILISAFVTVALLTLCNRFVKNQSTKDKILKLSAILTVAIHYSILYVDYFTTGSASVESTMLLPIYPCNIVMWLLLIVAFMKNRRGKVYTFLSEATFYIGIVGGIIGIVFNEIYLSNPNLADWDVLNGLLSHSTMLFGCIYLLVGKYINIRVNNTLSVAKGLMLLVIDGMLVIAIYTLAKMDPPNTMYLLENPFPEIPWFNTLLIGVLAVCLTFIITVLYEQIALPEENRWYTKIKENKERNI